MTVMATAVVAMEEMAVMVLLDSWGFMLLVVFATCSMMTHTFGSKTMSSLEFENYCLTLSTKNYFLRLNSESEKTIA
jgi:hypothetical protein